MIVFPNAKINVGLRILQRRNDGYHDIETVMMPVGWHDILEIVPAQGAESTLTVYGGNLDGCPAEKNLVMKALRAVEAAVGNRLDVDIYLQKIIPDGAGLGGGSADASFTIKALDGMFGLGLSESDKARIAAGIGADCPFFIYNRPMLATGTGTDLIDVSLNLSGIKAIAIAKGKGESVSTRDAYAGVTPALLPSGVSLSEFAALGPENVMAAQQLVNDFERSVFPLRPDAAALKRHFTLYGAVFSSLSGSGAAVYGMFKDVKMAEKALRVLENCDTYLHRLH